MVILYKYRNSIVGFNEIDTPVIGVGCEVLLNKVILLDIYSNKGFTSLAEYTYGSKYKRVINKLLSVQREIQSEDLHEIITSKINMAFDGIHNKQPIYISTYKSSITGNIMVVRNLKELENGEIT